jgi:hypothetical protein
MAHGPLATLRQRSKAISLPLGDQAGLALVAPVLRRRCLPPLAAIR